MIPATYAPIQYVIHMHNIKNAIISDPFLSIVFCQFYFILFYTLLSSNIYVFIYSFYKVLKFENNMIVL